MFFILIWFYNISPLTFQLYLECVDFGEDELLFKDVTIDLFYTCYQLSLVFQYIDVEYDGDDVECFGDCLNYLRLQTQKPIGSYHLIQEHLGLTMFVYFVCILGHARGLTMPVWGTYP